MGYSFFQGAVIALAVKFKPMRDIAITAFLHQFFEIFDHAVFQLFDFMAVPANDVVVVFMIFAGPLIAGGAVAKLAGGDEFKAFKQCEVAIDRGQIAIDL